MVAINRSVPFERPATVTLLALANLLAALLFLAAPFLLAGALRQWVVIGPLLVLLFVPVGLTAFVCGWALWSLRPVGRQLQIALACLGLPAFPLGTVVSLAVLAYLFRPRTRLLFSGKRRQELTPDQIDLLATPDASGALVVLLGIGLLFLGCGLVAALWLPRLLFRNGQAGVERTMTDMRRMGDGLEAFAVDHGRYPPVRDLRELALMLEPGYLSPLPRRDGWDRPYQVLGDHAGYVIRSAGADGRFEADPPGGATRAPAADIIFSNGTFVQYPEGEF